MYPALDLAIVISASLLFISVLHVLYIWYRLCHIPGPFWGGFTSFWDPRNSLYGQWALGLNKAYDQYGDVVRVGPNLLITNDVVSLRQLSPPKSKRTWGFLYQSPKSMDYSASSESLPLDKQHRLANLQRLFVSGPKGGLQIEECVDRQCARLVNLVERKFVSTSVEHRPMRLAFVVHQFATDVLGEVLWVQLLHIWGQGTMGGTPKGEALKDFLHQLAVCTETTTAAVCTTFIHLLGSPAAYSRLQAEIDVAVSRSSDQSITDAEAQRLPYLQAAIKEGRRIWPTYTAPFFEKAPRGGHTVSGHRVPEGTEIGPNTVGIMCSKMYWGQDAEVFRPERWLEAEATASRAMHETLQVFWALGRYTSLGRAITQIILNKIFPELLRRFDFALLHPLPPWDISNSGFWTTSGPLVRVTSRTGTL